MQTQVPDIPSASGDGDFLVQDPKRFATNTDSTVLQSFVFFGNKAVELDTTKSRLRYTPETQHSV